MKKLTLQEIREEDACISARYVFLHGLRQYQRNRRPSLAYKGITNPVVAYRLAQRDYSFHLVADLMFARSPSMPFATMVAVDPVHQPVSVMRTKHLHEYFASLTDRTMIQFFAYSALAELQNNHVTTIKRTFEKALSLNYYEFLRHYNTSEGVSQLLADPSYTREDICVHVFVEIFNTIVRAQQEITQYLSECNQYDLLRDQDICLN